MRSFKSIALTTITLLFSIVYARPQVQQPIEPAYLRDYYSQIAQDARGAAGSEATPIYEQDTAQIQQPQYVSQGQQIRIRDSVSEQIRAQQRLQEQPQQYVAPTVRQYFQQPQQQQPQQLQFQPAYQQQTIQYNRPQVATKQTLAVPRRPVSPAPPQPQYQSISQGGRLNKDEEEDEEFESNPSYQFGFDVKDDEYTNYQNRKEVRDGNVIKGSYSVVDSDGFIRTVTYTADPKEGFKADVVREPTNIVVKIPTPTPESSLRSQQSQQYIQQPSQYRPLPKQPSQLQQRHPQQYQYEQ